MSGRDVGRFRRDADGFEHLAHLVVAPHLGVDHGPHVGRKPVAGQARTCGWARDDWQHLRSEDGTGHKAEEAAAIHSHARGV